MPSLTQVIKMDVAGETLTCERQAEYGYDTVEIQLPAVISVGDVIAFFVTFLVMGVWHGTTVVFVVYGLLMGAGASINKLWQVTCTQRLGKKNYRMLTEKMGYIYLSRGITIAYFVLALTCLWVPELSEFNSLLGKLGLIGISAAFTAIVVCFALFWFVTDRIVPRVAAPGILATVRGSLVGRNLTLAGKMMAIIAVATLLHKSPDFVYKAF